MREAKQLSWDNYINCNPRPDAASDKALNTFLSQGADEEVMLTNSEGGCLRSVPPQHMPLKRCKYVKGSFHRG